MKIPWLRQSSQESLPKRVILADLSDTHGGHKLALMSPGLTLYDEMPDGTLIPFSPRLTAVQEELYALDQENIKAVTELAGDDDVLFLHDGDLTQGNKYPRQLVSTRMADQILIAVENLAKWISIPNTKVARIAMSTGSHGFEEGSADILVAAQLKERFKGKDIRPIYHGLANIAGVPVDYSHHGPYPGSRIWLKGNVARFYLRDLMMRYLMSGREPPKLVLRAHYHEYIEEMLTIKANGNFYTSYLVITPSMQMMSDYARQRTQSSDHVTNGMVAFEIVDGQLIWPPHRFMRTYDIRTKESFYE